MQTLGEAYHVRYRVLRNKYKWPPEVTDRMDLGRMWRIFEETIDDNEKDGIDEDDLE